MTAVRPVPDTDPSTDPGTDPGTQPGTGVRRSTGRRRRTPLSAWLVLPAALSMLAGLDAALVLLGVAAPVHTARLAEAHGLVMTLGFVGALIALERGVALSRPEGLISPIALERGVALSRPEGLISPIALAAGALALLTPLPRAAGSLLLVLGAAALVGTYVPLWRRQRDDAVLVQAGAAVLALGAALLAAGGVPVPVLVPWLVGFLVLTIAGERLELARVAVGAGAGTILLTFTGVTTLATLAALLWPEAGAPMLGAAYLLLTAWLVRHDVARRTVHSTGLTRFMAVGMLAGYGWLGVAGATWLLGGPATAGPTYDAVVHAVFLGFTLSLVMAHAPVILPAVLRRPLPWHPVLWAPLLLLHLGVVVRLWLGDARGLHTAWQVGGVLDVAALLLFAAAVAVLVTHAAGGRR